MYAATFENIVIKKTKFLGGVVVESRPRVQEVADLIPGRVIPKTLKIVVMAAILVAWGCGVSITYDWLLSG